MRAKDVVIYEDNFIASLTSPILFTQTSFFFFTVSKIVFIKLES
jgi:hypothetical protein